MAQMERSYIGSNGNWWIGDTDLEYKAEGQDGIDGIDGTDGKILILVQTETGGQETLI